MAGIDEPPFTQPVGQQRQRLGRGERGADAGPRARTERQILETVAVALAGEAFHVEGVGIVPQLAMAMQQPGPDRDDVAGLDRMIADPVWADGLAIEGFSEARLLALFRLPQFPVTRRGRAGKRGQIHLRRSLTDVVDDRWAGRMSGDFLSGMIEALRDRYPAGEAKALAVDNAATFYLAGHETTANALGWSLFLLSAQPELQEALSEEARAALAGADDDVAERVPRLRMFLSESLRLYPPVPRFDRQAIGPDWLGDHPVELGDIVSIWPWLLHRHRRLWDDPDAFDMDRFAGKGGRHRFQYLPFGAGPRTCVGAPFATTEALTLLAHWLSEWRFVDAGHAVRPAGMVTLRPAGGLPLRIERR